VSVCFYVCHNNTDLGALDLIAAISASLTKSVFIFDFKDQPTTFLENRSITTAKYKKPILFN